jgi:hypothetical protein
VAAHEHRQLDGQRDRHEQRNLRIARAGHIHEEVAESRRSETPSESRDLRGAELAGKQGDTYLTCRYYMMQYITKATRRETNGNPGRVQRQQEVSSTLHEDGGYFGGDVHGVVRQNTGGGVRQTSFYIIY